MMRKMYLIMLHVDSIQFSGEVHHIKSLVQLHVESSSG